MQKLKGIPLANPVLCTKYLCVWWLRRSQLPLWLEVVILPFQNVVLPLYDCCLQSHVEIFRAENFIESLASVFYSLASYSSARLVLVISSDVRT